MLRVRLALAAGLLATAITLGVVLTRSPLVVAGTNEVPGGVGVIPLDHGGVRCQGGGTLPGGTTAVRLSLSANTGPSVGLRVLSGPRLITAGKRGSGWGSDETVTVPVDGVARTVGGTQVCMTIGPTAEPIAAHGAQVRTGASARAFWLRLEYLRPGDRSWFSLAASVAHNMGVGHAPSGTWVAFMVIAVMAVVCVLASRLLLRELR